MPEVRLTIAESGRVLAFEGADDNPNGTDYIRVLDEAGQEVAYWSQDEWREEPEFVMGAIMGALANGRGSTARCT